MIGLLCFVLAVLASPFKSKLRLEAENAVLRHQLNVERRRLPGRVRLTNNDRWFFIQLYRCVNVWTASLSWARCILRRVLKSYADYYNCVRTHRSLNKDAPVSRPVQRSGIISSHAILGGLHHQ